MGQWRHIGVDWDSGSWVAVGITDDQTFAVDVYDRLGALWDERGESADRVVLDVPIGLCGTIDEPSGAETDADGELYRACDAMARTIIGSRSSSVFNPPCREVVVDAVDASNGYTLEDGIYAEMNEKNEDLTGKGLMQQGLNIAPGILEGDDLIRGHEIHKETIVEGHPELCFRAFAEDELDYSKRTAPGLAERLERLRSLDEYEEGTWWELASDLGKRGQTTGIDDLIDALALALTACAPDDEWHSLPDDYPVDGEEMPMRMVYRREHPLQLCER